MVAQGSNTGGGTYTSFSVSWGFLLYSGFFWIFLFEISSMPHHGNHGRSSATWGNHLFCAEFHPESTHVFSFAQILLISLPRAFYPFFRVLCLPGREPNPRDFGPRSFGPIQVGLRPCSCMSYFGLAYVGFFGGGVTCRGPQKPMGAHGGPRAQGPKGPERP